MIVSFANRQLRSLWETGRTRIDARLHKRILSRLNALEVAEQPRDMNMPGFDFHELRGYTPKCYTVHVNGPWCITFEFFEGDAYAVDLVQYH